MSPKTSITRRSPSSFALSALACLLAAGCGRGGTPERPAASAATTDRDASAPLVTDGYLPPGDCDPCHSEIAESYASVAMAQSFHRAGSGPPVEDWTRDNRFVHAPSGMTYEMRRDATGYFQRRRAAGSGAGDASFDRQVTYVIGSGRHARTYLHRAANGELTEMPLSWYSQEKRWGMSPGYDRADHPDFFRPVTYSCLFCHNAYPDVPAGADSPVGPSVFPANLPEGIDCQRCHGPGARHAALALESAASPDQVRGAIVNPARLSQARQLDVCMQCHLETTSTGNWSGIVSFGRGVFSYRPGEDLAQYKRHFDHPPGQGRDDKFEIAHQAYRLRQSACFLRSGDRMTCTTCHDPHSRPGNARSHFRARCLGCHAVEAACGPARRADADCAECHMPARRTDDVVHVTMTDHFIRRDAKARASVAPRAEDHSAYRGRLAFYRPEEVPPGREADLYLGVASVIDGVDAARGRALLEGAVADLRPRVADPHLQLGLTFLADRRIGEAIAALETAAALAPRNPRAFLALGNALAAAERVDEALARFDAALALWPGYSEAQTNAGSVLARAGRLAEALARFDGAVASQPDNAEAHSNRGVVLLRLGRRPEAEAALREALRIAPWHAEAAGNLAQALLARREAGEAARVLRAALARRPAHAGLTARLAWILATSRGAGARDPAEARRLAEHAVALTSRKEPRALDALAAALASQGDTGAAARVAAEARRAAVASGQADLAAAIAARQTLYEKGAAFSEDGR